MKRLSISQRMKRAKSTDAKRQTALKWAANWQEDQDEIVRGLERAVRNQDHGMLISYIGQLRAVNEKRFTALPGVLNALLEHQEKEGIPSSELPRKE